ncbi:hypothetical protein TWF718_003421 [Orbilia javanica]|uniref:C2H2-type domain-containing protein n=1 Tax=Orbilia javanica TaxID=47235 RepID=A0AAN8NKQ0_9PEZI
MEPNDKSPSNEDPEVLMDYEEALTMSIRAALQVAMPNLSPDFASKIAQLPRGFKGKRRPLRNRTSKLPRLPTGFEEETEGAEGDQDGTISPEDPDFYRAGEFWDGEPLLGALESSEVPPDRLEDLDTPMDDLEGLDTPMDDLEDGSSDEYQPSSIEDSGPTYSPVKNDSPLKTTKKRKRENEPKELPPFKCGFQGCTRVFKRKYNLQEHIDKSNHFDPKKHRPYSFDYVCTFKNCGLIYGGERALLEHKLESNHVADALLVSSDENSAKCNFPGCGRECGRKDLLDRHKVRYRHFVDAPPAKNDPSGGNTLASCHFPGCNHTYDAQTQSQAQGLIQIHERDEHPLWFKKLSGVNRRQLISDKPGRAGRTERPEDTFSCPFPDCDTIYSSKRVLIRHERTVHVSPDSVYLRCTFAKCNVFVVKPLEVSARASMQRHQMSSHPPWFNKKGEDKKVQRIKPGATKNDIESKTFVCPAADCDKVYTTKGGLRKHTLKKHLSQDNFTFSCTFPGCDRTYKNPVKSIAKDILAMHQTEKHESWWAVTEPEERFTSSYEPAADSD